MNELRAHLVWSLIELWCSDKIEECEESLTQVPV